MQRCKFCEAEFSADDRFCGLCGQTVDGTEAGKDLWSISTNTVLKSGERQYQGIAKETTVFDGGRSSYNTPQYDAEEFYPTILSNRSQVSEVPTTYADPWAWSPRNYDPKTPPIDNGSWMQPASRRRSPILILVTIAVVSAVIIASVVGFLFIKGAETETPPHVLKPPTLMVTPLTLDFGELERSVKLTLPFSISNTGGQLLSWSVTADAGSTKWLAVQTRSATIEPKDPQQPNKVTVDTSHLPLGPSFAYLTINSNGGKAQVTVKVDVIPPGSPKLNIIPTSLDFGTYVMAMPVPHQSIIVINGGTKVLKWQVNAGNARWLTLDKNSSTSWMLQSGGQQAINMAVNTGLISGTYSATVSITSNGGNQHVSVSLVVISPPPPQARLTVSPLSLNFGQLVTSTTQTKQVIVNDTGRQPLNWTAIAQTAGSGSWLSIYDSGGTINPGDPSQTINVKVDATHLATGNYSGTVTITASGAQGSPTTVGITLTVVAPPQLAVTPTSLTFSNVVQGTTVTHQVTVGNTGGQSTTWTAAVQTADGGSWLSIDNTGGTINPGAPSKTINVTANTSNLPAGPNSATLNFTSSNGGSVTLKISLTVNAPPPPPPPGVSPLDFGAMDPGATKTLPETITNSGGQPLNWGLDSTSLPGWLSVDTNSGTVQPGSSQTINVTANTSNLSAGPNSATLNFTSNGGSVQVTGTITVQ